jgi:TonB family protein
MSRLQKKCFLFSLGLHGLLATIILVSVGFRSKPEETPVVVLSMIPANLLDTEGASGGNPPTPAPPAPTPPAPTPVQPQAQPAPVQPTPRLETPRHQTEIVRHHVAEPIERPEPRVEKTDEEPLPTSKEATLPAPVHKSKPPKHHEVHVTYGTATPQTHHPKAPVETTESTEEVAAANARSEARAEARRLKQIQSALNNLAVGVQTSASARTVVDANAFGGGGEVFAGYRDAIFTAYYRAFVAPDNMADPRAGAEASITVARDGTIISAELISRSGEAALDHSAERALRAVTHLPPFPAGSKDEQRVFKIRFSLDAKESAG